jgi:hypothetical protein
MSESEKCTLQTLKEEREELIKLRSEVPYKIGKYDVTKLCLETNPCQHFVTNTKTKETYILGKFQIYLLCIWYWIDIPHFYPYWRICM